MKKAESDPTYSINHPDNILIDIIYDSHSWNINDENLEEWIKSVCTHTLRQTQLLSLSKRVELAILLSDDDKLQELNCNYRDKDKPTNVLSFPNYELHPNNYIEQLAHKNEIYLGDIAVSYSIIYNEAIEQDKTFHNHLAHMLVHSILHLLGYDHEEDLDAERMENEEIQILKGLNIPNPY